MLKIRRSRDRLIFNMVIPLPGKDGLYIETGASPPQYPYMIYPLQYAHGFVVPRALWLCYHSKPIHVLYVATVPIGQLNAIHHCLGANGASMEIMDKTERHLKPRFHCADLETTISTF